LDWIGLAKDRNRWRVVVNWVLKLRVPWNAWKLSSGLASSGLSSSAQLHIVSYVYDNKEGGEGHVPIPEQLVSRSQFTWDNTGMDRPYVQPQSACSNECSSAELKAVLIVLVACSNFVTIINVTWTTCFRLRRSSSGKYFYVLTALYFFFSVSLILILG
jgi:hypothetical protein